MSNWLSSLLHLNYQPLNTNSGNNERTLPGSYIEEPESNQRNSFNSHSINNYITKFVDVIQLIIFKPMIFILYVIIRIIANILNTIYFRDHFKKNINNNSNNDSINKANKFIRDLEDNLPNSEAQLPNFYLGSYTQALYMATQKGKFLFVYLTNPENESSSSIFNKIIINPKFTSIFNDPNIIIWGGDLTNPESYQLANSLNVTKFPFLGLLSLTRKSTMTPEGPVKTSPKISLLVKIQGGIKEDINSDLLIENKFLKKIEKYSPELKLIRNELWEKFFNQVMIKQQDLNYQKSLAQDKLKKQQKQREIIKQKYLIHKLNYFKTLKVEEINEKAKIAIKMPNGERITQYFPASSLIQDLFTFVELHRGDYFNKTDIESDSSNSSDFDEFIPDFKFKLLSPLPPKVTLNDHLNGTTIVRDLNCIYPNGLLIVEDL